MKEQGEQTKQGWRRRLATRLPQWRTPLVALVLFGVFLLGLGVGNGTLHVGRTASVTGLPDGLDYTSVNQLYNSIRENYDGKLTQAQLIDGLKHGLAQSTGDPYTVYFTKQEANDFKNQLNNTISGIGARLGLDQQGNIWIVDPPFDGTPAQQAGLQAQDVIATIDGKSTQGMDVETAVTAIRGKAGSKVTLQVIRTGNDKPLSFTITRQQIQVPTVSTKTLDGNIGYIAVSTFGDDTSQLIDQAAQKFAASGVKSLVLDLRDDPGGEVDAAVATASEWLPENSMIMQEKHGNQVIQSYRSTGTDLLGTLPTVVLVNNGSASASEIVTAALHDNKHAYVIGEKSYGKGVVQQIVNFHDGSELKVTVASWYRPNGQNINHKGITPDQKVVLTDEDAKTGNDVQLTAAEQYLQNK